MGFRIHYRDRNVSEEGHRLYRDTQPLDTQALPAPLVDLGPDVDQYDDPTPVAGQTYHLLASAYTGGDTVELFSDPIQVDAVELSTPILSPMLHHSFHYLDGAIIYPDDGEVGATIVGTLPVDNTGPWGPALVFGEDYADYVKIGDAGDFPAVDEFTVAFGLKVTVYPVPNNSFDSGTDVVRAMILAARSSGSFDTDQTDFCIDLWDTSNTGESPGEPPILRFFFYLADGSNYLAATETMPPLDTWVSVVCTKDTDGLKIYLDKTLEGQVAVPALTPAKFDPNNSLLRLGNRRYVGANWSRGEYHMTRPRFFDYGFTAQDVSDLVDELNGVL